MRILLAEDDVTLASQVKTLLTAEGRVVDVAHDGEEAGFLGSTEPYDMIILDLGLPTRDGISILKEWRSEGLDTPILILTARDGWTDRVDGLDAGRTNPLFEKDGVAFDTRNAKVTLGGVPVDLTSQEVAVLSYLIHNAGRLISRTELSEHIYEYDGDRDSNTIAVFITRLRKKLGPDFIQTIRGRGYMVDAA
ncbi:Transcriptional regulatory protein QseB [Nymphon striatum]|nr:Transcriptional regulatory protein QseB [Nymphon striatum]